MTLHELRIYSVCVAIVLMAIWNQWKRTEGRVVRSLGTAAIMIGVGRALPWTL